MARPSITPLRYTALLLTFLGLAGGLVWPQLSARRAAQASFADPAPASTAHASEAYGKLPLSFEVNRGQADDGVKFLARGAGYGLLLTATDAVLTLRKDEEGAREKGAEQTGSFSLPRPSPLSTLRMQLAGANPAPQVEGLDLLPGRSNYFIGNDPEKWLTDVPHYARVRYREVYAGVDLVYYGNQQHLEYDLIVAPGADLRPVRLRFGGGRQVRLGAGGELHLRLAGGEVCQQPPFAYQQVGGVRRRIPARYILRGDREVGFEVEAYDMSKPLVIDPTIVYSTFLGGGGVERAKAIMADSAGNAYVAGYTASPDFPITPGAFRMTKMNVSDVFVTKLNAAGTAIVYSTYLGGYQENCCGVIDTAGGLAVDAAVDAAGNVYVTGYSTARDFPVTPGAFQPAFGGDCGPGFCPDAFVAKLSATGAALVYSTFLGGNGLDAGTAIAVDQAGNAYVAGATRSPDFPTTRGAFQTAPTGRGSAFVTKLNAAGTAPVYSTLLGGEGETAYGIAVDFAGQAYVTGIASRGFPTTPNAFQILPAGSLDAFVTKLDAAGTAPVYSTLLGGGDFEFGSDIAVDALGGAYVTGYTFSRNFPVTPGAFQTAHGGARESDQDVFVAKLSMTGDALVYSTLLGGSSSDLGFGITVDAAGNAAVTGQSSSSNFPVTVEALRPPGGGSGVFVTRLNAAGTGLDYSTFLGSNFGRGYGVAADVRGDLYVTGEVSAGEFLVTPGAVQSTNRGGGDLFVTKLSNLSAFLPSPADITSVSAASYAPAVAGGSLVAAFAAGLTNVFLQAGTMPLPTALGGMTIKVRDGAGTERLAPILSVSPNQINYLMPAETGAGTATVTLERGGGRLVAGAVSVSAVAPGLFAANQDGRGVAAAVVIRIRQGGGQVFEPAAVFDQSQGRFVATPIDLGPETDQVYLVLFGTGLRFRSSLAAVSATIGGVSAPVLFAGAQGGFVGLDQVNVRIPRSLTGRGGADVTLTADGRPSNTVQVSIK